MKKIKLIPAAIMTFALAGLVMTGCKKEDDSNVTPPGTTTNDNELRTMYDNNIAEASYDDIDNVSSEGVIMALPHNGNCDLIQTLCAHVSLDLAANPHSATIDYGSTDCLGGDGNYRRGKVIVTWTGGYRDPGTVITVTTDNYYEF